MPISNEDLFRAILAMDSYNRGYSPGTNLSGNSIGTASIRTDITLPSGSQAAGFYAQAYTLSSGETVIAYRGTDLNFSLPGGVTGTDLLNGYGVGGGSPFGPQAALAVEFYNSVLENSPVGVDLTITGHSLGGGLAGYVAALYGEKGRLFDNMPFELAASNARFYANASYEGNAPSSVGPQSAALLADIYDGEQPWANDLNHLKAWNTEGEFLGYIRGSQQTPSTALTVGSNVDLPGVDSGLLGSNLHSMSLLVLLMYADNATVPTDWLQASRYFLPALFNDSIASAVGVTNFRGVSSSSDVMRDAIAYSAIKDGTLVFGDTGIRALFNDANDLGKVLGLANASSTLTSSATALSKIFTQFAGQLAIGKVEHTAHAGTGVLTLAEDQKALSVDFADALWSLGRGSNGVQTDIVGREDLIREVLSSRTSLTLTHESDIEGGMKWLWASEATDVFDRIVLATTNDALTKTLSARAETSSKVTVFVGGGSVDKITGSVDGELIYGGAGADELWGGGGSDLLAGGDGDDTLHAGAGKTYLAGGTDTDTASFDAMNGGTFKLSKDVSPATSAATHTVTHGQDETRLQSVEKITLSDSVDVFEVGANVNILGENSNLYGFKEIDAAGEVDTIDFSASRTKIVVESNKVVGPDTVLKNFEKIIATDLADTFKFSSAAEFAGLQKVDAGGQTDGSFDTLDFSAMTTGVTIAGHQLTGSSTKFENFEKIIGSSGSGADNIDYSNGSAKIELYGGGGNDVLTTGGGNDRIDGGAGDDILMGRRGNVEYTGGSGADIFVIERGAKRIVIKDADKDDRLVIRASDVSRKDVEGDDGWPSKDGSETYNPKYNDWALVIETGLPTLSAGVLYESLQFHFNIHVPGYPNEAFYPDYVAKLKNGNLELTFRDVGYNGAPEITVVIEKFKPGMLGLDSAPSWDGGRYDGVAIPVPHSTQIGTDSGDNQQRQMQFVAASSQVGDDHLIGSDDDDSLFGLSGNDALQGAQGVDVLDGGAGDDVLNGGTGNDELFGGIGSDTYVYALGDGNDIIGELASEDDINTLVLSDLNLVDVTFSFESSVAGSTGRADLIITITATGETIRVVGQFDESSISGDVTPLGLSQIEFANGSILDRGAIELAASFVEPTWQVSGTEDGETLTGDYSNNLMKGFGGDDIINGEAGSDTIYGGAGSDILNGGAGGDTFMAEAADGDDVINGGDGAGDTLSYWRINSSVVVDLQSGTASGPDIGFDTLTGIENVEGGSGNDILIGSVADNDLRAGGGNDTITGGLGDDTLSGGDGSDTYHFAIGDGDDFVSDLPYLLGSNYLSEQDVLVFGPGIDLSNVTFEGQGANDARVILANGGGSVALGNQLRPGEGIELFQFANGTSITAEAVAAIVVANQSSVGDDLINGTGFSDIVIGGTGDDRIRFVGSGDVIVYAQGDGNDLIEAESPVALRLTDLNAADLQFSVTDLDLIIKIVSSGETIRVKDHYADTGPATGVGQIRFADETVWDRADIAYAATHSPTDALLTGNSVGESAVNGTVVGIVVGVDPDPGATLTYALTHDAGGRFAIDAITGQIHVADGTLLDYEASASHDITVRVTDQNGLRFDKNFTIALSNVDEAPTDATMAGGTVAENAASGAVVGTVAGVDQDAGSTFTYALTDSAANRFTIDATTGVVSVASDAILDYELAAFHTIVVRVTDQSGLSFDKHFTIALTDVNEAPTDASLTGSSIAENTANGVVVGIVAGFDPDSGAVLTYALTNDAGGRFAINATTGQITVADGTLLDYESATSHGINVRVTDQDGLSFDEAFTISVTDVNESPNYAPSDATLTGGSIAENAANGVVVGVIAGVDPDPGAVLTYALTDNGGGRFAIDPVTGQITVADGTLINFENAASHGVVVRVTDQGGLTFDKAFTLNVVDANEAPSNATLTGNSVVEDAANGTVVGTIAGIDPDAGAVLTYGLTDDAGGRFAIDVATGQISVVNGALLDYESATSHTVIVRVTDQDGLSFDKAVSLGVTNVNEAPADVTLTGGSIAENSANGAVVGTLAGIDPDSGAVLTYALIDDADGRFAVNATTGEIRVADGTLLDYETAASHGITVRVTDQGGLTLDRSFTVSITDVNESTNHAPTDATLTGGSVAENAASGAVVGTLAGVDLDAGDILTYALMEDAGGRFAVNAMTGQITVVTGALLDYETARSHDIIVRVTDQGGLSFDKAFTLNVTDVNEAPANVLISGGSVAEDAANGVVVGTVAGVDSDFATVLTYALTNDAGGRFAINATTGQITVADGTMLDYEEATSHEVTVRITDQDGLTLDKVFVLNVSNVNEAPTNVSLAGGSVAENAANGVVVGTVVGVDPDSDAVLTYTLISDAGGRFAINAATGQITVADGTLLDYETAGSHEITARITDQGGLTFDKTFTISITDVNESANHAPTGVSLTGNSIAENSANGSVVGTLAGVDPDSGAVLTYSLTNNAGGRFAVNGVTGQITVAAGILLDYEAAASHEITVRVTDEGGLTFDKAFTIAVADVYEQDPSALWVYGTSGNDTISGSAAAEIFYGKEGNDYLQGNDGSDTYVYSSGDGNDVINDQSSSTTQIDTLKFTNLNAIDLTVSRVNGDLMINVNATGETIKVVSQFYSPSSNYGIEKLEFADGSSWDLQAINASAWYRGTSGDDSINASNSSSWIDTLAGGRGNDYLQGNDGTDIYVYSSGDGNDVINDQSSSTTQIDTLKFTDLNASDLTIGRVGNNLFVGINATGETIRLENQFYSPSFNYGIEKFEFADGSSWDLQTINSKGWFRGTPGIDSIVGSSGDDVLVGGLGNDSIRGNSGSDTYIYSLGDGNDTIDDQSESTTQIDTLKFTNLNAIDLTVSRVNGDLMINVNATGETIKVASQFYSPSSNYGIEKLEFADGSSWDLQAINASAWYRGTSGDDSINASNSSSWIDTLAGGRGNDYLQGNDGTDIYVYSSGDGNDVINDQSSSTTQIDTLKFTDLNASDLTIGRVGNNLFVGINATGETIRLENQFYSPSFNYGIEKFEFADGSSWDLQTINSKGWFRGTPGIDSIVGSSGDDVLVGGLGNDNIRGNSGSDTYIYSLGDGNDTIDDQSESTTQIDTLKFTNLNAMT